MKKEELSFIDEIEGNALPYISKEFVPIISHEYDDILHLKRPEPGPNHPRMSMEKRAAQFSPFAALSGHKEAVIETERLTEEYMELTEAEMELVNQKLHVILENLKAGPQVSVTYFVPDERKEGGEYTTVTGTIKKIDEYARIMLLQDRKKIPLDMICDIESEILNRF